MDLQQDEVSRQAQRAAEAQQQAAPSSQARRGAAERPLAPQPPQQQLLPQTPLPPSGQPQGGQPPILPPLTPQTQYGYALPYAPGAGPPSGYPYPPQQYAGQYGPGDPRAYQQPPLGYAPDPSRPPIPQYYGSDPSQAPKRSREEEAAGGYAPGEPDPQRFRKDSAMYPEQPQQQQPPPGPYYAGPPMSHVMYYAPQPYPRTPKPRTEDEYLPGTGDWPPAAARQTARARFKEQDDKLLKYLKKHPANLSWRQIGQFFPGRNPGTLQVRFCTKLKEKEAIDWNDERDQKLSEAVDSMEKARWKGVAQKMGTDYTPEVCQERWGDLEMIKRAREEHDVDPEATAEADPSPSTEASEGEEETES